ncbi:NAC domain-containing protein 104-like [Typha angustifolia]|uniref:NAC domain-containing protein 104-like n=1 Tax=Typha angustifolia TaxID=59011 RepID=UPI003C2F81AF
MGEGGNLPPGFRFFPSDEELVVHFLRRKSASLPCQPDIIPTIDLHHHDPWDLNGKALQGGNQWYFFTHKTQTRSSPNGHWSHAGGRDEPVTSVGVKKTFIFYCGDQPHEGIKTNWVMHEYHLLDTTTTSSSSSSSRALKKRGVHQRIESNEWVICRVYETSCHDEGAELSCLDEVFLSLDDLDEVSLPK